MSLIGRYGASTSNSIRAEWFGRMQTDCIRPKASPAIAHIIQRVALPGLNPQDSPQIGHEKSRGVIIAMATEELPIPTHTVSSGPTCEQIAEPKMAPPNS